MEELLADELFWLTLTILSIPLHYAPYTLERIVKGGFFKALSDPQPDLEAKAPWAVRSQRAHKNAIENLILFAPMVITVELLGVNNEITSIAAMAYFVSRIAYLFVYTLGVPFVRPPLFGISLLATIILGVECLKAFFSML